MPYTAGAAHFRPKQEQTPIIDSETIYLVSCKRKPPVHELAETLCCIYTAWLFPNLPKFSKLPDSIWNNEKAMLAKIMAWDEEKDSLKWEFSNVWYLAFPNGRVIECSSVYCIVYVCAANLYLPIRWNHCQAVITFDFGL